jgi:circadian clock protein KaiC
MQNLQLISTTIANLDLVLGGGIPIHSLNIIAGPSGSGKTILVQQMMFSYLERHPQAKTLYLSSLSKSDLTVLKYAQGFKFFDARTFEKQVVYSDLSTLMTSNSLSGLSEEIMALVDRYRPELIVWDSIDKVTDLSNDRAELRVFYDDLSSLLADARVTSFLIKESRREEIKDSVELAIADGIFDLDLSLAQNELIRSFQVSKLRGASPLMQIFPFKINGKGISILSPSLSLQRLQFNPKLTDLPRSTGVSGLDTLLRGDLVPGRSLLLSGASGTGKTTLALQFLVQGAKLGEKGLLISYEEPPEQLARSAANFNWQLRDLELKGLLKIIFVSQAQIQIEEQLEQMIGAVQTWQPDRLVIDSLSSFLSKVKDTAKRRETVAHLATLIAKAGAIGMITSHPLPTDFGIEETVVDGTIILSSEPVTAKLGSSNSYRCRYLEVYKMRDMNHVTGKHRLEITSEGIEVFCPSLEQKQIQAFASEQPLIFNAFKDMIQGEIPYSSSWLVEGETGVGKSTLAYQFAIEALQRKESVLYITADIPKERVCQSLQNLGCLPDVYLESGQLLILDLFGSDSNNLELSDPRSLLLTIERYLNRIPHPCRQIFDSLAPLAIGSTTQELLDFIYQQNRLLSGLGVSVFNTLPPIGIDRSDHYSLLNAYDVVVELYTPNWGEMSQIGRQDDRALKILKLRGAKADLRPYPYTISMTEGIILQKDYYR